MRKVHSLLAAACLLAASCNREEIQPETDKAGMYHITVAVTGTCRGEEEREKGRIECQLCIDHRTQDRQQCLQMVADVG